MTVKNSIRKSGRKLKLLASSLVIIDCARFVGATNRARYRFLHAITATSSFSYALTFCMSIPLLGILRRSWTDSA
ncbi:hypothetical protein Hanom_Chr12g01170821 [Helianthus anomalus]